MKDSRENNALARTLRGGAGGDNDPGAHGLKGAHGLQEGRWLQRAQQRAHELEMGPIEMTLRNQHVKPEDLFFGDHLISTRKTVRISVKTFSFRRLHHFSDQTATFSPPILDFTKPEIRHI